MGKKMGMNEKVADARTRKADAKTAQSAKVKAEAEEAAWKPYENPKGKKDAKREDEEKKKAEAAARKAEIKRLAAEEEAAMAKLAAKNAAPKKVTSHILMLAAEAERRKRAQMAEQRTGEVKREVTEDDYARLVEVENANRDDVVVEARSVEAALKQMSVGDGTPQDRHPEKRAKAAFEDYYQRMLPVMKEEKPGLKLMQYKSRIFELWQRSPENPRNQPKE